MNETVVFGTMSLHALSRDVLVSSTSNPLLLQVLELINTNEELQTLWQVANVHAIKRMGITDHGPTHFRLVAQTSLKMIRLLIKRKVTPSIVTDFGLTYEHAEVVVLLAALFHDIGMTVHRKGHEEYSITLTNMILKEMLAFLPVQERTIIISEVLHAIISHRRDGRPLTLEAGVVRVADALDMTNGRCKVPYLAGKIDIHSVSAMAVDEIHVRQGKYRPIEVDIVMNHTAGVFQVDELLSEKVKGSGIEGYLDIKVYINEGEGRRLFKDIQQEL